MTKNLHICDICGKEVKQTLFIKKAIIRRFPIEGISVFHYDDDFKYRDNYAGYKDYDVCEDCFLKIIDEIKKRKKEEL